MGWYCLHVNRAFVFAIHSISLRYQRSSAGRGAGKRSFPVEEGSDAELGEAERWKTEGFQGAAAAAERAPKRQFRHSQKPTGAFSLTNTTRSRPPMLPYRALARAVLGTRFELSVVLVGDARARALNRRYRGKDKSANVLAFPLGSHTGEIMLNLAAARREAPRYGRGYRAMVAFLFIHGLLHLKGLTHGRRMESEERALLKKYLPHHASPSQSRHRH